LANVEKFSIATKSEKIYSYNNYTRRFFTDLSVLFDCPQAKVGEPAENRSLRNHQRSAE
jgi:hypothetical protein